MNNPILTLKTINDFIRYAQTVNPKREPLTPEKLRQFPGCEQYSEEQAVQLAQTIDILTTALFETVTAEKKAQLGETETIPLKQINQPYLSPQKQNAA